MTDFSRKKNKHASWMKKSAFIVIFALIVSFLPVKAATAHAWLTYSGVLMKQNLEVIYDMIKGAILSTLKQQAAKTINSQMEKIVGGNGTQGAKFITDWSDYLFAQAEDEADQYFNDYISQMFEAKGSYMYEGFGQGGSNGGTYAADLKELLQKSFGPPAREPRKISYTGNPKEAFKDGTVKGFGEYVFSPDFWPKVYIEMEAEKQKKLDEEQQRRATMAMAYQGFTGTTTKSGNGEFVTNPGSVTKEVVANAQDIGNKIIANARNFPEVITAMVSQMIMKSVEQGIGKVSESVNREIDKARDRQNQQTNQQMKQSGPKALFDR